MKINDWLKVQSMYIDKKRNLKILALIVWVAIYAWRPWIYQRYKIKLLQHYTKRISINGSWISAPQNPLWMAQLGYLVHRFLRYFSRYSPVSKMGQSRATSLWARNKKWSVLRVWRIQWKSLRGVWDKKQRAHGLLGYIMIKICRVS